MDRLIYVSKGHIPNLGHLGPLLHVEKFVVGGGVESNFSDHPRSLVQADQLA